MFKISILLEFVMGRFPILCNCAVETQMHVSNTFKIELKKHVEKKGFEMDPNLLKFKYFLFFADLG